MNLTTFARNALAGILGSLIAATSAVAATYHVKANGDDAVTCTQATQAQTAKRTVAGAVSCLTPGSTLLLGTGRYPTFVIRGLNATASAPITIKALGDGPVTIDRHLGGPAAPRNIEFFGSRHIIIEGLELTDSDPLIDLHRQCDVVNDRARCISIANKEFTGRVAIKLSALSSIFPEHIRLAHLEIHHVGAPLGGKANHLQVLNNHIFDNGIIGSSGIYVYGDRFLISGNRVHDNNGDGIRMGSDAAGTEITNSIIEKNISFNHNRLHILYVSFPGQEKVRVGGEGILVWHGAHNIVRNNIVYRNSSWGIRVNGTLGQNNHVYNNTVYQNGRQGIYAQSGDTSDIKNNISFANQGTGAYAGELFIGSGNTSSHNFTGDPQFVSASRRDFRLKAVSLAINRGMTLAEVPTDFAGVPRRAGSFDIGAFEFEAGSPRGRFPSSVTNLRVR